MSNAILALIAGGSPAAAREATAAIRAREAGSPMAAARAARAAGVALGDPQARFTAAERREIAALLEGHADARIEIRLTPAEKAQVQEAAEAAGQTVSEYIRSSLHPTALDRAAQRLRQEKK